MPFGPFSEVKLSPDGTKVLVKGPTDTDALRLEEEFGLERLDVAVIAMTDDRKRLQKAEVNLPISWTVTLPQKELPEGTEPFENGEKVYVVGMAKSKSGEIFLWGGVSAPTPDVPHAIQIGELVGKQL